MKIVFLIMFLCGSALATSFTEWYVQTTGNNLNSGSTTDDAAVFTYAAGTFATGPSVFTCASENPSSDGVTNGMWASIYTTAGATNANFIALITNVTTTTIGFHGVAIGGSAANVSTGAGEATCKIGGAWKGPNTSVALSAGNGFPFPIMAATMTNGTLNPPCYNFKAGVAYTATNAITVSGAGPFMISGYSTTPRDGGKFVLDGSFSGNAFNLLTISGANIVLSDCVCSNNGTASASSYGLTLSGARTVLLRCVITKMIRGGVDLGAATSAIECEAYNCNSAGQANQGGFHDSGAAFYLNCNSHDNYTSSGHGFYISSSSSLINCITYKNQGNGFQHAGNSEALFVNCNSYSNKLSGWDYSHATPATVQIMNCASFKNGGWDFNASGGSGHLGYIYATVGQGDQASVLGPVNSNLVTVSASGVLTNLTYYASDQTPWTDAINGNFALATTSTMKATGRSVWTQTTVNAPTNTVAYPDVGAVQSASTNAPATGGETSHTFAQ